MQLRFVVGIAVCILGGDDNNAVSALCTVDSSCSCTLEHIG